MVISFIKPNTQHSIAVLRFQKIFQEYGVQLAHLVRRGVYHIGRPQQELLSATNLLLSGFDFNFLPFICDIAFHYFPFDAMVRQCDSLHVSLADFRMHTAYLAASSREASTQPSPSAINAEVYPMHDART